MLGGNQSRGFGDSLSFPRLDLTRSYLMRPNRVSPLSASLSRILILSAPDVEPHYNARLQPPFNHDNPQTREKETHPVYHSIHPVKMGWFSWSSSDDSKSSDGGRIAPDRSSRERCWEGRDRLFACLDRNHILDAVRDDKGARSKCGKEVEEFEGACAKAWVCFPFFLYYL